VGSGELADVVAGLAVEHGIPGVAVGVWTDGQERVACSGVTSTENPLPVDPHTLFVLGSVTKTYTATALMSLVARGQVDLAAPVRRYVPELVFADEQAAQSISVLELLNHTSGLDWGLITDTGEGDDALSTYVARLAALDLLAPPGARASYSQAGYNLAGRVLEKVTGLTYEQAVARLVLQPLGLSHSFYARDDIMTRRFVVGHNRRQDGHDGKDGELLIARLWRRARGDNPGGGLASSVSDQLRWARFHLGQGRADSGARVLPADVLQRMQQPTAELQASNLGEAIGLGWFLRGVDGADTVGHSGSANGQFADLLLVPERGFAVVALSNAGPDGIPFNRAVLRWALQTYLGLVAQDPQPLPHDPARARQLVGDYANDVMTLAITTGQSSLRLEVLIKPAIRAAADKELPPDHAPFDVGLLPGRTDEYVITSGAFQGQRGFFTRDHTGAVTGVDLAGRLFNRTPTS
jgi:CubicO group peptidase (beta-lactamase class C family)